jgi:hypothetical protein
MIGASTADWTTVETSDIVAGTIVVAEINSLMGKVSCCWPAAGTSDALPLRFDEVWLE